MAGDVTTLLEKYQLGDTDAFDELTRLLYPELKRLARHRARSGNLGATTLIQETYARYLAGDGIKPANRQDFFGLAATIMRRVIVDDIRQSLASKRKAEHTADDNPLDHAQPSAEFIVTLDRALDALNRHNDRLRRAFECRYFAGYTTQETAEVMGISERTAERLWAQAKAWIANEIG